MTESFSIRMWKAIAFIERNPISVNRQLDAAFENSDGDAMCAALYTMAEKRPRLKQFIQQFVSPPSGRAKTLMGKSMKEIQKAAQRQREEGAGDILHDRKQEIDKAIVTSQGLLF